MSRWFHWRVAVAEEPGRTLLIRIGLTALVESRARYPVADNLLPFPGIASCFRKAWAGKLLELGRAFPGNCTAAANRSTKS
jgi:hypothetical protein